MPHCRVLLRGLVLPDDSALRGRDAHLLVRAHLLEPHQGLSEPQLQLRRHPQEERADARRPCHLPLPLSPACGGRQPCLRPQRQIRRQDRAHAAGRRVRLRGRLLIRLPQVRGAVRAKLRRCGGGVLLPRGLPPSAAPLPRRGAPAGTVAHPPVLPQALLGHRHREARLLPRPAPRRMPRAVTGAQAQVARQDLVGRRTPLRLPCVESHGAQLLRGQRRRARDIQRRHEEIQRLLHSPEHQV
mmetsp:Transcript_15989/g.46641  ORF Transcript_15989/g.46641 Transcript_15989/m.46641 type:complete len:242 (-) Transcript_15989:444-1169(-)